MKPNSISLFFCVVIVLLGIAGCSNNVSLPNPSSSTKVESKENQKAETEILSKVELLPEDSGAISQQMVKDLAGNPTEIRLKYINGDYGYQFIDKKSGQITECKETFSDGKTLKSHVTYDKDGKTVLKGELYRPDGSLRLNYERLPNGRYSTTKYPSAIYYANGNLRVSIKLFTIYSKPEKEVTECTFFAADGKKEHVISLYRELVSNIPSFSTEIQWYRKDGSLYFVQTFASTAFDFLRKVIEYQNDGKTLKREISIISAVNTRDPKCRLEIQPIIVTYPKQNGLELIRILSSKYNSTFQKVESLDNNRVLVTAPITLECEYDSVSHRESKSANHSEEDNVQEQFDLAFFSMPGQGIMEKVFFNLRQIESCDYFGQSSKNDPCRSWYNMPNMWLW